MSAFAADFLWRLQDGKKDNIQGEPMNYRGQHRLIIAIGVFFAVLLVVVGSVAIEQVMGQAKSGNLTAGPGISSTFHNAEAWNGTTWVTLTAHVSGDTATMTTPAGFHAIQIVIFEANPTYDMGGLLNTSNIYSLVNIGTSTTAGHYINLTAAYEIMGSNVNGTSMTNHASKGWTNVVSNTTLYNANVNVLNQSRELNLFSMYRSFGNYLGYNIILSDTGVNATTQLTLTFTQGVYHPFALNLVDGTTIAVGITAILGSIGLFLSEGIGFVKRRV